MKIHQKFLNLEGTSHDKTPLWKTIWSLDIPPRVRMFFAWRLCHGALPTKDNIAKRISTIDTECAICGHILEMDVHVLLQCPLATQVWEGSPFRNYFWNRSFLTMWDYLDEAVRSLAVEELGNLNGRNRFIFQSPDYNLSNLNHRALAFVSSYRSARCADEVAHEQHDSAWRPPPMGVMKGGWGLGVVIRNSEGDMYGCDSTEHGGYGTYSTGGKGMLMGSSTGEGVGVDSC
ncbi:hypothetical protein Cgig2_006313 [Carnegiea gigantea]|uniref:Reverse transcriptase zinc-binding domain-containing protein n=1 Tax=Carnegiea gigantea TaxID=171969 RepID=A0A9Q1JKH9_9CARY|nr:hypothetical protein Cgig2_006313 [Carnegiea gigantea]